MSSYILMKIPEREELAFDFAKKVHADKTYNNDTYFNNHVLLVVKNVKEQNNSNEVAIIAAYLHDTVEDTSVTIEEIISKFGADVASVVGYLTHDKDVTYANYILNIRYNETAIIVKLADLKANIEASEWSINNESKKLKYGIKQRLQKYQLAEALLKL